MKKVIIGCLALMISTSCSDAAKDGESYSKSQAALMQGQSESGRDICAIMDWYGDGECDDFCPLADEDCVAACTTDTDCSSAETCSNGACVATTQACSNDAECTSGQICVRGACEVVSTPACLADSDCATGEECTNGVCEANTTPECVYDTECYPGEGCINGSCQPWISPSCADDDECGRDKLCIDSTCQPNPNTCGNDAHCNPNEICFAGICRQTENCGGINGLKCGTYEYCDYPSDARCGAGGQMGTCLPIPFSCEGAFGSSTVCGCDGVSYITICDAHQARTNKRHEGTCFGTCFKDNDCPNNQPCRGGQCQPVACTTINDCSTGETCVDGFCDFKLPNCSTDANCTNGEVCASGFCEAAPRTCAATSDCSRGEACVGGICEIVTGPTCNVDADCLVDHGCFGNICLPLP